MRAFAVLAAFALAAGGAWAASGPGTRPVAGEQAVCGGVGSDERRALSEAAPRSNLSLEMFAGKHGAYVAEVDIRLMPLKPSAEPITLLADGPICHLQVPSGRYRIEARFNGATRTAHADVPGRGRTHVAIAFPEAVGDRQTDVPTPDEKLQAARIP